MEMREGMGTERRQVDPPMGITQSLVEGIKQNTYSNN